MSKAPRYLEIAGVKVCLALFVSSIAVSAYAQDAPNPVGEFLDAFRGKPVGPVAPPPASSAAVSGPQAPVSNTNQASTMAAQADATVTANTLSCPPGVDRAGCVNASGQRVRSDCPAGMTAGPTGCVPMACRQTPTECLPMDSGSVMRAIYGGAQSAWRCSQRLPMLTSREQEQTGNATLDSNALETRALL